MATNENFKSFSNNVDIIWLSAFTPLKESLKHIDPEKVIVATGWVWNDPIFFNSFKKFHKYFHSKTIATNLLGKKLTPKGLSEDAWKTLVDGFTHEDLWTEMGQIASSKPISYKVW